MYGFFFILSLRYDLYKIGKEGYSKAYRNLDYESLYAIYQLALVCIVLSTDNN
jgi:hypothetical protein